MKKVYLIILALTVVVMPFFQNCGMDAASRQSSALFVGEKTPECLSPVVDCGPKAQYLEITVDIANPSRFSKTVPFTVYGRCNEGNYPYSGIYFRMYYASNPGLTFYEKIVKSEEYSGGNYMGHCINGRYTKQIPDPGETVTFLEGVAFVLEVKMIGYSQTGTNGYENAESMGKAQIDLSFFDPAL